MTYVDEEFYRSTYEKVPEDFTALERRAAEIIEEMTCYRLTELTFEAMPDPVKMAVKKAVCAEIEYLDANGGSELDLGAGIQSATLGKFSFSQSTAGEDGISIYAPRAYRILLPTGLLYRGGGCY